MGKIKIIFCFLVGLILISIINYKCLHAKNNDSNEQIMSMLKEFYTSYITSVSENAPYAKIDSIRNKYCTSNLLMKLKKQRLDYDPFLKAQDSKNQYLNTLSIKRDSKNHKMYYVSYIDDYNNTRITIKLIILKQEGCYKINVVW